MRAIYTLAQPGKRGAEQYWAGQRSLLWILMTSTATFHCSTFVLFLGNLQDRALFHAESDFSVILMIKSCICSLAWQRATFWYQHTPDANMALLSPCCSGIVKLWWHAPNVTHVRCLPTRVSVCQRNNAARALQSKRLISARLPCSQKPLGSKRVVIINGPTLFCLFLARK